MSDTKVKTDLALKFFDQMSNLCWYEKEDVIQIVIALIQAEARYELRQKKP